MSKLPYIPDKNLYAAVMGACSWIRESGYFNKAINYYAEKYDVSVDDVAKYVRIAQGNGQRKSNKQNPRKYFWYAIEYSVMSGVDPYFYRPDAQYEVIHATSETNAKKQIYDKYFVWGAGSEGTSQDAYFGRIEEFITKEEATECINKWSHEKY